MRALLRRFIDTCLPVSGSTTFSQCGEDALLRGYFLSQRRAWTRWRMLLNRPKISPGFYVDVGAYSPKRISNTYWFYQQGWRGITIEPDPKSCWMFRLARPRDTHLCLAIGEREGPIAMKLGDYSGTNRIINTSVGSEAGSTSLKQVEQRTLGSVLAQYVPEGTQIDILSIDCEGHDLGVLRSNNWNRFRPLVICVEDFEWCESRGSSSQIADFLRIMKYCPFGWAGPSVLWCDPQAGKHT